MTIAYLHKRSSLQKWSLNDYKMRSCTHTVYEVGPISAHDRYIFSDDMKYVFWSKLLQSLGSVLVRNPDCLREVADPWDCSLSLTAAVWKGCCLRVTGFFLCMFCSLERAPGGTLSWPYHFHENLPRHLRWLGLLHLLVYLCSLKYKYPGTGTWNYSYCPWGHDLEKYFLLRTDHQNWT